jgi:hypothetical protein
LLYYATYLYKIKQTTTQSNKMEAKNQNTPLTAQAKEVLLSFAPYVSRGDKKDAADSIGVSKMTIYRYLTGNVSDIGIAEKIIGFLRPRIDQRKNTIAA